MIYDYENKTMQVKIVYYGPAMSGKTASIKSLFSYFNKEQALVSIDSTVGRTLFFDFGVLKFEGREWNLKFLIYSVTGQDFYAINRPTTLNGVDGIIFVVDARSRFIEHNIRSWNELTTLFGEEIADIPIVFSLNKDDIDDDSKISENDFLNCIKYGKIKNLSLTRTVALDGKGILESFNKIVRFIFPQLTVEF